MEALPAELAQFATKLLAGHRWDRAGLTRILEAAVVAAGAATQASVNKLGRADTLAVVTGQQPAVGGGPLYTLVKVAHAIVLADQLSAGGIPAVPVFWCASEDHDLGEAGHADLVTRRGEIQRFHHDLGGGRASLRFRPAAAWWEGWIGHCRQHLGDGAGSAWLRDHAPRSGEGLGAWQCRLLENLFTAHGLICVEAHHLRPLWTPALAMALDNWPAAALGDLRRRLFADGVKDAFGDLARPPLFADRPEGREALDPDAARRLLVSAPLELSPGAALRPVLQQAALPCAAYVAGPGELAYHAFLAPVYAALDLPAPYLVPRCSLTLVPDWLAAGLARWDARPEKASPGAAPPVEPPLAALAAPLAGLDQAIHQLEEISLTVPAHLHRRLVSGLARLRRHQGRLAASLERGERSYRERPAWGTLVSYLHPRGERQERTLSLGQALWEHGPELAERLVGAARKAAPGEHVFVTVP
jgi:uncharacterized protein YllA (UPF0747 family)